MTEHTIHLFGGEREYCTPGMDGYIQQCADIYEAVQVAEREQYEWAQIIQVTPTHLRILNVGRWDNKRGMIWQADSSPFSASEAYLRSFYDVLKSGILILARLPGSDYRRQVMTVTLDWLDEMDKPGVSKEYPAHMLVYLMRQLVDKLQDTIQRTHFPKKKDLFRKRWLRSASALLDDTRMVRFNNEGDI